MQTPRTTTQPLSKCIHDVYRLNAPSLQREIEAAREGERERKRARRGAASQALTTNEEKSSCQVVVVVVVVVEEEEEGGGKEEPAWKPLHILYGKPIPMCAREMERAIARGNGFFFCLLLKSALINFCSHLD